MFRHAIAAILCLYIGAGLFGALLMKQAVPALNVVGISYMTATWPRLIYCARKERNCDPMPPERLGKYLFSFPKS